MVGADDDDGAWAYLSGGPAGGTMLRQGAPHWAPLKFLHVSVGGRDIPYVRVEQPQPPQGRPWRYVPASQDNGGAYGAVVVDPSDD